jgi:tetratricopeptide (TPR) repeat protein
MKYLLTALLLELHVKLGFTYTRLGRADAAQRAFENAVRLDPRRAIAHYMLGLIYEKKGLKDKAIAAWKACLETAAEQKLKDTAVKHLNNLNAR